MIWSSSPTHRESTPTAPHARETVRRPADFSTLGASGGISKVKCTKIQMHTLPTMQLLNWRVQMLHPILNLLQSRACCLWHTLSLREGFLLDNCERWQSRRCFSMGRKSPPLCSLALQTPEIETIISDIILWQPLELSLLCEAGCFYTKASYWKDERRRQYNFGI